MSAFKINKFRDIVEMQHFLNGGIIGGADLTKALTGAEGVFELVGTTLTFTAPAHAVTFVAGAGGNGFLTLLEIKTQIEAAVTGIKVLFFGGRIAFINSSLAAAVAIGSSNEPIPKRVFGFPNSVAISGKLYGVATGAAPSFQWAYQPNDGSHVVFTFE
jgi:hypothetical protein